jgi:hypothetical protein
MKSLLPRISSTLIFTLSISQWLNSQSLLKLNYKSKEIRNANYHRNSIKPSMDEIDSEFARSRSALAHDPTNPLLISEQRIAALRRDSLQNYIGEVKEEMKTLTLDNYTSFLGNFNGITVLPNVNFQIDKTYNSEDTNRYPGLHTFKVFSAGTKTDSSEKSLRLLFTESSKFGIQYSWTKVLAKAVRKRRADCVTTIPVGSSFTNPQQYIDSINRARPNRLSSLLELNYLGKDFSQVTVTDEKAGGKKDTLSFNSHILHLKMGLEYAIVTENISVFGNFNCIIPLTKREELKMLFESKRRQYYYADIGVIGRIEVSKDDKKPGIDMYLTLGVIVNNGDLRGLNNNNRDVVIPYFRWGLNTNLNKFFK